MSLILFIIIIVLIFSLDKHTTENKKLNKKIKELTEENKNLKVLIKNLKESYIDGNDLNIQTESVKTEKIEVKNLEKEKKIEKVVKKEAKEVDKNKIKNTTILLTGAFLIILAAIILLMSTWSIMPNFVKTVVLFMFALVFIGISKKADKMGLKDTSKTFFNLAMAYIPICFVSVSLFGLLGEYLSINGDGKFIYLTAVFLAISGVYYRYSKVRDSKGLFYSSILSQLFTVVLFSLIFEKNINLVLLNVCLYNILLLLVPEKDNFIKLTNMVLSIVGLLIGFLIVVSNENTMITTLGLLANFASFAILANRKPNYTSGFLMNISLIFLIFSVLELPILELELGVKLFLMICSTIAALIIEENLLSNKKFDNIKYSNYIMAFITMVMIFFVTAFNNEEVFIKTYIVAILISALSAITYLKYKNGFFAVMMSIAFTMFGILSFESLDVDFAEHGIIIPAIAQFVIFKLFAMTHKDSKKWIEPTINIILGLMAFIVSIDYGKAISNDFGYFLLIFGLYAFSEYIAKNNTEEKIYRVLAYISSGLVLSSFFNLILENPENLIRYVPLIVTIISIVLENIYKKFDDKANKLVRTVGIVLSCLCIAESSEIINVVVLGISSLGILIYNRIKNEKDLYDIPIMIACFISMALSARNENEAIMQLFMIIFTAFSTIATILQQKISFYTIMSYLYLFNFMDFCDNTYINNILFLGNSLLYIPFMKKDKDKDIFKFLSAASGLALYVNFTNDFVKLDMVSLDILGWMCLSIYVHNYILNKYLKKPKNLRILTYIIVYAFGLQAFSEMADLMLLMFIQLLVIMYGYSKREEAEFISSTVMLILNSFLLTSWFWFAIPWWIYLIVIGGALISFGIKNESKEKKKNVLKEMYNDRFK